MYKWKSLSSLFVGSHDNFSVIFLRPGSRHLSPQFPRLLLALAVCRQVSALQSLLDCPDV